MIRIVLPPVLLTATLALTLPAQAALLTRTFVSSAGVDTNPCTIAQPCATFQRAYGLTAANGIIAALDPGKYGPLTNITTGVTINGNGWAAITAPAGGVGITINAGTGNVTLIGLEIDGAQAAYNGVVVNSARSLTVTNCTLQNFVEDGENANTGNGIVMMPSSGTLDFTITDTTASNNASVGIFYDVPFGSPNATGIIRHVSTNANLDGIGINPGNATSGSTTVVTIADSVAGGNGDSGIFASAAAGALKLSIDNVISTGNSSSGIFALGTPTVLLGRSVINGNASGIVNMTSPHTFYTYNDNRINSNGVDIVVTNGSSAPIGTSTQ